MLAVGNVNIGYKGIPAASAPPVVLGADNGLSVDSVSGNAVLGQDVGDPSDPALLLSDRIIPGAQTVVMPTGKFGLGEDTMDFLPSADQKFMVLSDQWTDGLRAAAAFFRSMVTPSAPDVLIDSIIPGSFSAHLRLSNGSFVGGPGSVIAAIKGNLVTQGANPDPAYKTVLQLNSIDAGWLPLGEQNITRVALLRAQRPDTSGAPTGTVDEVIGMLIESMDSAAGLGSPDTYGIRQEGEDDENLFFGPVTVNNQVTIQDPIDGAFGLRLLSASGIQELGFYIDNASNGLIRSTSLIVLRVGVNNVIICNPADVQIPVRTMIGAQAAPAANTALEVRPIADGQLALLLTPTVSAYTMGFYIDNAGNAEVRVNTTLVTDSNGDQFLRVGGNNIFRIASTGDVEVLQLGGGIIQKSPDGTRWRMTISNAGVVSAVLA